MQRGTICNTVEATTARDADALPKTPPTAADGMATVGERKVTTEPEPKTRGDTEGEGHGGGAATGTSPRWESGREGVGARAVVVAVAAGSETLSTRSRIGMGGARTMECLGGGIPL